MLRLVGRRSFRSLYRLQMNVREMLGLATIVVALVLVPVAWTTSRMLWLVSFLLLVLGSILFVSERIARRLERLERETGGGTCASGHAMPTDVHNFTGWRSGGRSETMDSATGTDGE